MYLWFIQGVEMSNINTPRTESFSPYEWWFEAGPPSLEENVYHEDEIMWVYRQIGTAWVVGFYSPSKEWYEESSHSTADLAALRVRWLNGGTQ